MIKKISFFAFLLLVGGLLLTMPTTKVQAVGGVPACSDGIDNDGDSLSDFTDPECHNGGVVTDDTYMALNETEGVFAGPCPDCGPVTSNGGGGSTTYVCSDSLDNEGDGKIDAADPACHTDGDVTNASSYNKYGSTEINQTIAPKPQVLGAQTSVCGGTTGRPCLLQKTGGVKFNRFAANAQAKKIAKAEGNSIVISKLNVNQPVLQLTNPDALFRETRILPWTSTPDKGGNTVLVGHAYYSKNGNFSKSTFYELDTMAAGDEIVMTWKGVKYTYVVKEVKKVTPEQISIEDQTVEPTLTIYSCGRFTNAIRNVVVAELKK